MKKTFLWLFVVVALSGIGLFYGLYGRTFEITIPKAVVLQQVVRQFPTVKHKGLVSVAISHPELDFQGSKNRLGVKADAEVSLLGLLPVRGTVIADGTLEYKPESGVFAFTDITVSKFNFKDLPANQADAVSGMLASAMLSALGGLEIYKLDPGDVKENIAKLALRKVRVSDSGIVVSLSLGK